MKKTLSVVLALVLCFGASLALADTFGLGIVTSIDASTPGYIEDGEAYNGRAQVDSTICAVILDDKGVIVDIYFDVAQTRVDFTPEGEILSDLEAIQKTKMEKRDGYNMRGRSPIGAELFEQVNALRAFCIGKTAEEVLGMKLTTEGDHAGASADADLATSCTITINEYLAALAKAVANAAAGEILEIQ
ncbi:MAG: hypothetical protein FWF69_03805 [Firmicutes bacterium]|nr:hypothetical protein [Bacillota bacterium]